jgi:hypothetical protein
LEKVNGQKLTIDNILLVWGCENSIRIALLDFNGLNIKVTVCHQIKEMNKFLNRIQSQDSELDKVKVVEVV